MLAIGSLAGCDAGVPLIPRSETPMVYAILARDSLLAGDSVVTALVANAGTATSARYRPVESFRMRRERDGTMFAWRIDSGRTGSFNIGPLSTGVSIPGNITMMRSWSPAGLGRDSLAANDSYLIDIRTMGAGITARVRMPARPRPVLILRDGREVVAWSTVPGAAGYAIRVDTDLSAQVALRDTEYVLRRDRPDAELPPNPRFILTALDSNLVAFLTDPEGRAAGVGGAYGVIGGMTSEAIPLKRTP